MNIDATTKRGFSPGDLTTCLYRPSNLPPIETHRSKPMIQLTRLNGASIAVNCDLIKLIEANPDTTIALVTGEKLIVREPTETVLELVHRYRASVLREAWPEAATGLAASVASHAFRSHAETERTL